MDIAPSIPADSPVSYTRKTLGLIAGSSFGKVLGVSRDVSLAFFFGTSGVADAFRVSLAAALVPTHFFMSDVLDSAFVPLYIRYRNTKPASAARLFRLTGLYLITLSLLLTIATWSAGTWLVRLVAPGLAAGPVHIATRMVRWMGLGIPFYSIAALLGLYGVCMNRFRPLALRTSFQNAGLTAAIALAAWFADPQWIGLGFTSAFVLYLGYVVVDLRSVQQTGAVPRGEDRPQGDELRVLFRTASPLVFMMILGQMLAIVDRAAASFVGVGAIASLDYARVFVETPHVLIGSAIATAALSRFSAVDNKFVADRAGRMVLSLLAGALGLMVVLAAVAPELVSLVYRRGRFDAAAAVSVTLAVRGLALGGAFMSASYVMNRVLSAQLRSRESISPMLLCILVAIVANFVLMPRLGVFGVGLAMSLAYLVLCGGLAIRLNIGRLMLARMPGWTIGAILAAALEWVLRPLSESPAVRLGVIGTGVSVAWFGVLALIPSTRADIASLWAQVSRAYERPP